MEANSNLRCSNTGQDLIKKYEKLELTSYRDSGGILTIGWRHTGTDVFEKQEITETKADKLFLKDLKNKSEIHVQTYITTTLNQNQFDALCSLVYSSGSRVLQETGIRKAVNNKDFDTAYDLWLNEDFDNGIGKKRRKREEASLFKKASILGSTKVLKNAILEEKTERKRFLQYTHTGGNYTVAELLSQDTFVVEKNSMTDGELLGIIYKEKTNHRRLFDNLITDEEYDKNTEYPVTEGSILIIPNSKIRINIRFESNFLESDSKFSQYFPGILKEISNDPLYKPKYLGEKTDSYLRSQNSVLTIYGWSRTLYLESEEEVSDKLQLGYLDLTKDITSIVTTNSIDGGGGTFTIEVSPLQTRRVNNRWEKEGVIELNNNLQVSQSTLSYVSDGARRRARFYYQEIFTENDLMFISFEELGIEKNKSTISNNWYDMIGMIDSVQVNTAPNHNISIVISGTSLSKVLHSDNSYFNPYSIGTAASIFGRTPLSTGRFLDGKFHDLSSLFARSIRDSVNFIFHRISSIDFVPDDIFFSFDNLTIVSKAKVEVIDSTEDNELYKNVYRDEDKEVKGIWQIIKLFIDDSVRDLRIVDDSISNPNGTIYDLIKKVCQDPFVEMFTDTYGDKFYIIIRRPPFDEISMADALVDDEIPTDFQKYNIQPSKSKKEETLLIDNEISIFGENELSEVVVEKKLPKTIHIEEGDIISENLAYSQQSYSWYQLTDRGNYAGANVTHGVFPGVYFDEIAQVFGNSRLSVTSNYSNQDFWQDSIEGTRLDKYAKHGSELLGWLIETNIYLPFTRLGTIVIQGDRRIKTGTFIYYVPTQEVFYVKSVTQQLTVGSKIDRTTQLVVERGMVRQYMTGEKTTKNGDELSYFNLVNIKDFKDSYYKVVKDGSSFEKFDYKSGLTVNKEVLEFFLKRRQSNG